MESKAVFSTFNEIKEFAAKFIGIMIDFYGSPENDQPIIRCKSEHKIMTFNGEFVLDGVIKQDDGSITVSVKDNEGSTIGISMAEIPVETSVVICNEIAHECGVGEMFDSMFDDAFGKP